MQHNPLSCDPLESRRLLAAVVGLAADNRLVVFDSSSPQIILNRVTVKGLGAGESLTGIDFGNGGSGQNFWGLTDQHRFYRIDLETGAATASPDPVVPAAPGERLTFDFPEVGVSRFQAIGGRGRQFGGSSTDPQRIGRVGYAPGDAGEGTRPDIAGLAYAINGFPASTTVYAIDAARDALVTLGTIGGVRRSPDTGRLYTIGDLGIDAGAVTGFDVATANDGTLTAFASLRAPRGRGTLFCTVDLETGDAGPRATVGDGRLDLLDFFALGGDFAGLALTAGNSVAVINNEFNALGRHAITGLGADEAMLSLDFRPGTNELFGVSSRCALYQVDTTTGAARAVGARFAKFFRADPIAADFDPVSGHLRVLSEEGEVLRLDPQSGDVIDGRPFVRGVQIDPPLAYADGDAHEGETPDVVTIAHASSVASAASTKLYGIDRTARTLVSIDAFTGHISTIGAANYGIGDIASLDIRTTVDGDFAFAGVRGNGERKSKFYFINLATGEHLGGDGGYIPTGSKPARDIAMVPR